MDDEDTDDLASVDEAIKNLEELRLESQAGVELRAAIVMALRAKAELS